MKTVKIAIMALFIATSFAMAQGENAEAPKVPDFKMTFSVLDTRVIFAALQEIQLVGKEAPAYMIVQDTFKPHLEKIASGELKNEDSYTIEMPAGVANALFAFVNRTNVAGANAERLVSFKKVITEEAQRISDSMPKTDKK